MEWKQPELSKEHIDYLLYLDYLKFKMINVFYNRCISFDKYKQLKIEDKNETSKNINNNRIN
jgi:hypothetical protein